MRFAQFVMGPAGSGKSTYCSVMARHAEASKRTVHVVNLDPAAEYFDYEPIADIRSLIHVDDTMEDEELSFGPNGGLVFCMEYLLENLEWLEEQLGDYDEDYIIFDCPGQIELYTHMNVVKRLVEVLQGWNFRVCGVFILDSHFMVEGTMYISGTMTALSVMVNLEIPHVNVLQKMDLLSKEARNQIEKYLEPDRKELLRDSGPGPWGAKYHKLTNAIGKLIDRFSMVRFVPLDITDEESVGDLFMQVDNVIQYGEDAETRTKDFEYEDPDDET